MALAAVGMLSISSCEKEKKKCNDCHCQVENPLIELEWLGEKARLLGESIDPAAIYSCKYQINKDGYFIESCIQCPDNQQELYDCEGNLLCSIGGFVGAIDTVYNIDYNSFQLIYQNTQS
jgi:hypothetical protein